MLDGYEILHGLGRMMLISSVQKIDQIMRFGGGKGICKQIVLKAYYVSYGETQDNMMNIFQWQHKIKHT